MECRNYDRPSLKQYCLNKILACEVIYWIELVAAFLMEYYRVILFNLKAMQK